MPAIRPDIVRLYRITHRDNLEHILQNGLCGKNHTLANPNFVSIGNNDVISKRSNYTVKIPDYGNVGDYVPFYFSPLSMMLYNILTGYGVPKVEPQDIVFIITNVTRIIESGRRFFFTDGQANTLMLTNHYNDLQNIDKIDWPVVMSGDFKRTIDDVDRSRRYQAEFLVYSDVPVNCIEAIVVYNEASATFVNERVLNAALQIPVHSSKKYYFNR